MALNCRCRVGIGYWQRVVVPLSDDELALGAAVGEYRLRMKPNGRDRLGTPSILSHVVGAIGEVAFCKAIGVEWSMSEGTHKKVPDVAPDFEIRFDGGWGGEPLLKITPEERASAEGWPMVRDRRFVLIQLVPDGYAVLGWLRAREVPSGYPARDPGQRGYPAHFLPLRDLHRLPFDARHEPVA